MKKLYTITLLTFAGFAIASFLFVFIRQAIAKSEIEAEWQTIPNFAPELKVTTQLEIIPLYEAASEKDEMINGHGVSYLIRTDSATVLLDVGNNPDQLSTAPFMQNMQVLGIAWDEVDRIVISHSHADHVGGTQAWKDHTVSLGNLELPRSLENRLIFVPVPVKFKGAIHATIPSLPAPDVATTGVIAYSEVFPLSLLEPKGSEQALVVHVADQGLILITGCGHPGLEQLVERAETLYGQPVIGVVGGLHYVEETALDVAPHIQFLQNRQVHFVALSSHDSNPEVLSAFKSAFGDRYHTLSVGEVIHFP